MQCWRAAVGEYPQLCHYDLMHKFLTTLMALLWLSACATPPPQPDAEVSSTTEEAVVEPDPAPEPEPAPPPQRAFPEDSFYQLLVAEFALRRQDYDTALTNYMEQAPQLRDRGVSAHTSRLAQYLKKDDAAIEASTLWVEVEPDNLEARLSLANLLARQGRGQEALPHMAVIVRAGGVANFTALANGFSQLDPTAQGELLADVDALHREYPANSQLLICKALMLESMGQTRAALDALQLVFKHNPDQLQAIVLEAKLQQDLGQVEGVYQRIEDILREQPGNSRLRMQYARLLTRTDIAAARRQFQMLLDDSPNDPEILFSLALIQREMGDLAVARDKLEKLVGIGERKDEAHYYLGRIAEQEQRWEDALMHYMQVKPGRDFVNAARRLSNILLLAGRRQEHARYFEQLRQRIPSLKLQLYAVEVESLNRQQLQNETVAVLDKALVDFPADTSLQYMRAMAYEKLGDIGAMERDLRDILTREPDNATVLNALGYTLANRTERYQEAEQLILQALELDPNEPAILDSYGWVRFHLGDYQTALDYLRRAYQAFPDPEVAAHLGEVLWVMGEQADALAIWQSALQKDPDSEVVLETMNRLGAEATEP